ncbi:MAG: SdiA-regulated domain-containing protein [Reichenbachiella sp.]
MVQILLALLILSLTTECTDQKLIYNLNSPDQHLQLSAELNEISGMVMLSDSVIAAVQDEKGHIYYLNAYSGNTMDKIDFGKNGDYEGITYDQNHFYVLRSDGRISETNLKSKTQQYEFKHHKHFDFEGLCLDQLNNRLLVACKEHGEKEQRDDFFIYSFSLASKKYDKKPAYRIKRDLVHNKFKPSAIAVHPDGSIYILSSFSKTLLVLSVNGSILYNIQLSEQLFPQPEGITFNSHGDLFISNEKNNQMPTILKFNQTN